MEAWALQFGCPPAERSRLLERWRLCNGPPCATRPQIEQAPPEPTQSQSFGSKSSKLLKRPFVMGSQHSSHLQSDQLNDYFTCPACHLQQSLGCPAPGCGARFRGLAAWSLRLNHIASHLGDMTLLLGGPGDIEFVHWASTPLSRLLPQHLAGMAGFYILPRSFLGSQ